MQRIAIAMVGLCLAFSVAACGSDDESASSSSKPSGEAAAQKDTSPIVIGAAVAKTGMMAAFDVAPMQALQLAAEQMNAEGGIDGRQIEFKIRDTASDRAKTPSVAEKVLADGADVLVVSCDFDYGGPAAQVAQKQGKLSISLCAASLKFGTQGIGPLAFTTATTALNEGFAMADFAVKRGWKTAFQLIDPSTSYAEETCVGFAQHFPTLGGKIVGKDTFKQEDASIASQINRIKSANPKPDVLDVCSFPPGLGTAMRQIRAAGIDTPVVSNAASDGIYWLEAVPKLSDFYLSAHGSIYGDDSDPEVNKFIKEYTAKYDAPANAYVLHGPVLLSLYAQGVKDAGGTDSAKVAEAMNKFKDVPTLMGPTSFTAETHIAMRRPVSIVEFKNGKPGFVEKLTPSATPEFKLGS
jgi:branched-chain amino acid transport system substrate-binding protein